MQNNKGTLSKGKHAIRVASDSDRYEFSTFLLLLPGRRNPHPTGRVPKYQNKVAFTPNPNGKSKKTKKIMEQPITGLCQRCTEQIEWRKQYRKYKPLKTPATCRECRQKTVVAAYHNLCKPCADAKGVCAKCCGEEEIVNVEQPDRSVEIDAKMKTFKERTKRTILRKLEKGEIEPVDVLNMVSDKKKKNDLDDWSDEDDDLDDEDDDNEEEGQAEDE